MDYVRIVGTLTEDGTFTPMWWRTAAPDEALVSAESGNGWAAVALGPGDEVLARAPATVTAASMCPGGLRLGLQAVLELPEQTNSVALLNRTHEVYRRVTPRAAARIALQRSVEPTLARQRVTVPLSIDGVEPGPGAYLSAAWEVPGQPATPLDFVAISRGERPAVRLDGASLPAGEGWLSVTFFDGVRSFVARSGLVAVPAASASQAPLATGAAAPDMLGPIRSAVSARWEPPWRAAVPRVRE